MYLAQLKLSQMRFCLPSEIVQNKIVPTENVPTGVDPKCDFGPIGLAQVLFFHNEIQPIFDISIQ